MIKPTWEKLITWQQREIKPAWQAWLLHTGSFMQRLVQHGVNNARIKVLSQRWRLSNFEQSALLSVGFKTPVLVRDALIVNHNQFWMFARTVIPRHTLTGEEQVLAHLKERSLGSVLFKNPALQRSEGIHLTDDHKYPSLLAGLEDRQPLGQLVQLRRAIRKVERQLRTWDVIEGIARRLRFGKITKAAGEAPGGSPHERLHLRRGSRHRVSVPRSVVPGIDMAARRLASSIEGLS